MKKLFKKYPQAILIGSALILLAILGTCFFWGGKVLLSSFHAALKAPSVSEGKTGFDIETARSLNLRVELGN